ncbi:MAG TPA: haloacid dehalogenase-like hydrolase, partial [Armatimonadota bacterium]|nr:haloacid dehalogenase-like hydrolase [Armatimonadota bacterium]
MRARPIGIRLVLALVLGLVVSMPYALAVVDPLPAWNDGPAKSAIISFVRQTTTPGSPGFVPREERFATFDQDGTLWVEQPMYAQVVFTLDRVRALAAQHPEWRTTEPFKTVLSGDQQAIAKLSNDDIQTIATAVYTGMTVEDFQKTVRDWLATARHPRWNKPY